MMNDVDVVDTCDRKRSISREVVLSLISLTAEFWKHGRLPATIIICFLVLLLALS
jgi:hypothetical protein